MKRFFILLTVIFFCTNVNTSFGENFKNTSSSQNEMVLFIVDFSNSMSEKIKDIKKIDMVLDTVTELLPSIPQDKRIGLRVYGHKNGIFAMQACKASDLLVPVSKNSAASIRNALFSLSPSGWTPITYSLKQAVANDFGDFAGKKRIILLSDGGENCDESPCDYAMELIKTRDDISIDVIAFNITDPEANNQLKCAALATYGKFYTANTAAQLMNSLSKSLNVQTEVEGKIIQN